MASAPLDLVGVVADPETQGLGRLIGQYVNSPKLIALLRGLYELGQDLDGMFQQIARFYDIDDDITQAAANTDGARGAQLLGIGRLVGMSNMVPAPDGSSISLTVAQFILLVKARIYRNTVKGGTIPQLLHALLLLLPDLETVPPAEPLITISEIGQMTTMVVVGREMTDWEVGAFAVPSGISMIKGGLLPRPDGVLLATYWQAAGCFGFSSSTDPGVPLKTGALGFNSDPTSTTGRWARSF